MLMRAEYLYQNKLYDEISFDFVDGFKAKYSKWAQGYRISVKIVVQVGIKQLNIQHLMRVSESLWI